MRRAERYRSRARVAALALTASMIACSGSQEPGETTTATVTESADAGTRPEAAPVEQVPSFLEAEATGETEEAAYAAAVDRLEVALLGDDRLATALGVVVHDPARDPLRRATTSDGMHQVVVGLDRERVEALLANVAELPLQAAVPAPLVESLNELHQAYLDSIVCQRRQALLEVPCSLPADADVGPRLRELAQTVRLQPVYQDGIPLDASGHPLRPLTVRAEHSIRAGEWVPLPGLPVAVEQSEGTSVIAAPQAISDGDGVVRVSLTEGSTWPEGLRVVVDRQRLLGALAELWPVQDLLLMGRRTSLRRWCLAATVRVQGQTAPQQVLTSSLQRELGRRGARGMFSLPSDVAQRLRSESQSQLAASLPALADSWAGRVDVLIRVELDSEFASSMSAYHMWYEARGNVEVYDVWTGRRLTTQETTVTASGVGDDRADRAAQTRFAAQVAEQLVSALPLGP